MSQMLKGPGAGGLKPACCAGNWKQVSDIVGTKDERECEYHYFAYYINTASGAPVPDVSKAVSKTQFIKQEKHVFDECIEAAIAGAGKVPGKLTKSEWKKHMIETKGITRENIKYYDDKPPGSDVVGFMPARGDMDMEWENDSEALICECSFDDKKDTEQDKELKMKVLEAYNWKLEERIRRKQFIIDRNLLDYKKQHSQERRRAKDEREIWQEMRQFARFWPQEEHEEFMRWLIHENKIRKRVQQLQSWRKAGLHTFADGDSYELHKAKKEIEDKQKRAKTDTSGYILAPKAGAAQRSERLRMRNEDDFGELDMMQPSLNPGAKKPGAYEITGMAGSELLGKGEADVCRSQRVSPLDYIQAKEAMIRQSVLSGSLKVGAAKLATPKLDPAKATKIHEFMVNAGWITATMGGEGSL